MYKPKKQEYVSECHHAELIVEGDITRYNVCSECNQPCDGIHIKSDYDLELFKLRKLCNASNMKELRTAISVLFMTIYDNTYGYVDEKLEQLNSVDLKDRDAFFLLWGMLDANNQGIIYNQDISKSLKKVIDTNIELEKIALSGRR